MDRLTPEEAMEGLGIHQDHEELFLALWELLRTPEHRSAELNRLRDQMESVDHILREAGIEHPLGSGGVRNLAELFGFMKERRDELGRELKQLKSEMAQLKISNQKLEQELTGVNRTLKHYGVEKEGVKGLWKFAVMYEDARDGVADGPDPKHEMARINEILADLTSYPGIRGMEELVEQRAAMSKALGEVAAGVETALRTVGLGGKGTLKGVRELVDLYLAMQDRWVHDRKDCQVEMESDQVVMVHHAPEGDRYEEDSFTNQLGEWVLVQELTDETVHRARIIGAMVAEDGRSVEFTLERDVNGQ